MSKKIPVTLTKSDTTQLEEKPPVSLGKGYCEFPFEYRGKKYESCVKRGDDHICATSVTKSGKLKTYAICKTKKREKTPSPPAAPAEANNAPKAPRRVVIKKKRKTLKIPEELAGTGYEIPELKMITPEVYELPNRKNFVNYIDDTFKSYKFKAGHKFTRSDRFTFFNQQKLVRDYLQHDSPYRGLLLYHGLGVGKTCASIAIAEGFKSNRKVVVLLNKSLQQNFIDNLMKCGYEYFRINQHWEFKPLAEDSPFTQFAKILGVPTKVLRENAGLWVVNFSKKANYDSLSGKERASLQRQIDAIIKKRYSFISMDGITSKNMEKYLTDRILDDAVLVVDEVHNITNSMAKEQPGVRASGVRRLIMEAKNLKCVFLSGTPMINDPYETAQLFNLLRGYTPTYTFTVKAIGSKSAPFKHLEKIVESHILVNQYIVRQRDNQIIVTQNPYGFVNTLERNGIQRNPMGIVTEDEFTNMLRDAFSSKGYRVSMTKNLYSAFPENRDDFNRLFIGGNGLEIRNTELFKSRILGLVSHYKTQDRDLLPTVVKNEVLSVPMSDYQFMKYSEKRKAEIEQNKSKGKSKPKRRTAGGEGDNSDSQGGEVKSSYRAYSRMHCSFAFPEDIPRPYIGEISRDSEGLEETLNEMGVQTDLDEITPEMEQELSKATSKAIVKEYERRKNTTLKKLDRKKLEYLVMDEPDGLVKYSPKYNNLLNNMITSDGNVFIYTEYKTLEGIAVLSVVLKANGYDELKLARDAEGDYVIDADFSDPEQHTRKRFLFWGENPETSELLRKIYNNQYDELPEKIQKQLALLPHNNLKGQVVQVLLTTKTGAEGIDLHNVRQVHIIEPYWNPVRLKQVMGRAVRVNSHKNLPKSERTVEIFTYIATITTVQKKADKQIEIDSAGMSSDEVLYQISQNKLSVMNTLLKLIKEASVDCSLNAIETMDPDEPFTCVDYGPASRLTRENYSYTPNIMDSLQDRERARRYEAKMVEYKFAKIRGTEYAVRGDNPDLMHLYDATAVRSGRPGKPIGEIAVVDGKRKMKIY
jgi:superfamily II DNA or RNA helicase